MSFKINLNKLTGIAVLTISLSFLGCSKDSAEPDEKIVSTEKLSVNKSMAIAAAQAYPSNINTSFDHPDGSFSYSEASSDLGMAALTGWNEDRAQDALSRVADLLSYSIYREYNGFISIDDEIEQIDNIITLQRMRYDGTQNFSFMVNLETKDVYILPLILISLVENFFHHGNLLVKDYRAKMELKRAEGYIVFETENKIAKGFSSHVPGNRLHLIEERLSLAYKNDFVFQYSKKNGVFKLLLKIPLNVIKHHL